jgi:hypothetical protein
MFTIDQSEDSQVSFVTPASPRRRLFSVNLKHITYALLLYISRHLIQKFLVGGR